MAYTTEARVRDETGFTWNTNITTTVIQGYLDQANGVVLSYVAARYDASKLKASSDFTDSQAENMLKRCEELLASGYLLIKEYWAEGADTDKDGYKKVEEATALLEMIMRGEIRLLKFSSKEFELATVNDQAAGLKSIWATSWANIFSVKDQY